MGPLCTFFLVADDASLQLLSFWPRESFLLGHRGDQPGQHTAGLCAPRRPRRCSPGSPAFDHHSRDRVAAPIFFESASRLSGETNGTVRYLYAHGRPWPMVLCAAARLASIADPAALVGSRMMSREKQMPRRPIEPPDKKSGRRRQKIHRQKENKAHLVAVCARQQNGPHPK
ncbi:hypothetical protein TW95_gp0924 [Pandoravirus inopinatum]|uniref:Uncharacterized protein n=1 Tax=Pandoravirus inopinatum TaxID=1605721 RepID=A0A0B5IXY7_9VIRU|nr:hypothetical protein TW95_gp0924 [Pandoravirus inopinatum]AJF97658.1 hypothetical protein [Pandoravirus inopinatum]